MRSFIARFLSERNHSEEVCLHHNLTEVEDNFPSTITLKPFVFNWVEELDANGDHQASLAHLMYEVKVFKDRRSSYQDLWNVVINNSAIDGFPEYHLAKEYVEKSIKTRVQKRFFQLMDEISTYCDIPSLNIHH